MKLAALVAPEVQAGRLVSALAGTATVAAVYALAARLMGPRRALLAAGIVAVADGRVVRAGRRAPALTTLLVAVSYLASARGRQRRRASDAGIYGAASGLALYSGGAWAIALAPQLAALVWLALRGNRPGARWGRRGGGRAGFPPWGGGGERWRQRGRRRRRTGRVERAARGGRRRAQDAAFGLYAPAVWDRAPRSPPWSPRRCRARRWPARWP